jgi:formylmethanofuran dehydrogenase subunit E
MLSEKNKKISATGILTSNVIMIDEQEIEWIDFRETSLAALAKVIGIDPEHKSKVNITIEIVEQPCEQCGKPATGDQICQTCGKLVCDECARTDATGRYCPVCYDIKKQPAQQ